MILAFLSFALAHPSGHGPGANPDAPAVIGQRFVLTVAEGAVTVGYVVEVPGRRLARDGPPAEVEEALLLSLPDAVRVAWDDAPLPLEWGAGQAAPADQGFVELSLSARAPLPGATGRLSLRNGNFPDEPGFYATAFTLPGDLVATATSLASVREGRVRDNRHGAWVKEEAGREAWVDLRPARPWERRATPAPLPERLAGLDALAPPWWTLGGGLLLGLGLGFVAWWGWRRRARAVASPLR